MKIETSVKGNYIKVRRENAVGLAVCLEARTLCDHTVCSLTKEKALALAHEILRLVRFSEPEPLGADW